MKRKEGGVELPMALEVYIKLFKKADKKFANLVILMFQMQLKFSAPPKPGIYSYNIILRSDSYFDFDQIHNIKVSQLSSYETFVILYI